MKIHWGTPKNSTEVRSWTGVLTSNSKPPEHCYVTHEAVRQYGISLGHNWFFGFILIGETRSYRSPEKPRVGIAKSWDSEADIERAVLASPSPAQASGSRKTETDHG
ncbi:hypothetical protein [Methylobacterium sp. CM6244]